MRAQPWWTWCQHTLVCLVPGWRHNWSVNKNQFNGLVLYATSPGDKARIHGCVPWVLIHDVMLYWKNGFPSISCLSLHANMKAEPQCVPMFLNSLSLHRRWQNDKATTKLILTCKSNHTYWHDSPVSRPILHKRISWQLQLADWRMWQKIETWSTVLYLSSEIIFTFLKHLDFCTLPCIVHE